MSKEKDQTHPVSAGAEPGRFRPGPDPQARVDAHGPLILPTGTLPPAHTTSMQDRRGSQRLNMNATIAVSIFIHLFAFAAWAFFPTTAKISAVNLDEAVVKTRLVKLGKPRDPELLPRIPTTPPPPTVEKKEMPVIDAKVEPEKKSATDILDKFKNENLKKPDLNDLINKRVGEPDDEGQEFGDKDGSALDGEITDSYFARVTARIVKSMELSSVLTDDERVRLRAVLCLQIDEGGEVSAINVKGSGSTVFDSDVTAAARRASPLPAPPPPARRRAAAGVCFNVCPLSCS